MRKVLVTALLLLVSFSSLRAQEQTTVLPGRLTVFFPNGIGSVSLAGSDPLSIHNGIGLSCPSGTYLLRLVHPDFEPFEKTVEVRPGAEVIVLAQMKVSPEYLVRQADSLVRARERLYQVRRGFFTAAMVQGALSLVSAGIVGVLEWKLASQKGTLASEYSRYHSASGADAPGIWDGIVGIKAGISDLRQYENIALGSAGGFALAGAALFLLRPSPDLIDDQIELLRGGRSQ